jgi:hypothetical protein
VKVGDLVKYKSCGTFGVITKIREGRFNQTSYTLYEVIWSDGHTTDVLPRRLEAVCK